MMWEMVVALVYLVGMLYAWWRFTGEWAWRNKVSFKKMPENEDYMFGALFGFFAMWFWPLAIPFYIHKHRIRNGRSFFYLPPEGKEALKKAEKERLDNLIEERQQEIRRLDAEIQRMELTDVHQASLLRSRNR
jgi:hypothetical protein